MGYELYRMIRDGAPATWTGPMVHVAQAIADDARDPDGAQDGPPWSALPIEGHRDTRGRWRDGLAERTGMSTRAISRALADLAAAGYEMRQQIATDKHGRPVFAARGHAVRFRVPPLRPRPVPESSPSTAAIDSTGLTESSPSTASIRPERSPRTARKVAKYGDPVSSESPQEDLSPQAQLLSSPPEVEVSQQRSGHDPDISGNGHRSPMTAEETAVEYQRQADMLTTWQREHPDLERVAP